MWDRYAFDRRLRVLVMDAIERIEIAVRTQLSYHHAHRHGPFAYATDAASLPKLTNAEYTEFLERVRTETDRSREVFVDHFCAKYGDCHACLPVWMLTEVTTFGTILTFFRGSSHQVKQSVATVFGMPAAVLNSWLLTLNSVRNTCAHHGRLWNRELGIRPFIPRIADYPDWHTPVKVNNNRMFAVLTLCRYALKRIAPQSAWAGRFHALMAEFPDVPRMSMGFPANWQECPIWQ